MRHLALISVLAVLVAGCGATGPSQSAPAPTAVPTVMPSGPVATPGMPATPAVTPPATSTPSPSPKIVAGWPKVRQGGVTMTGRDVEEEEDTSGEPAIKIKIKLTGLIPGEVVSLSGTGRYDRAVMGGPLPSGCQEFNPYVEPPPGQPYCEPAYSERTKGQVTISEQATADASGTARATLHFVMPETKDACPVTGGEPGWLQVPAWWKVRVTDQAHGLRLGPATYYYGP